MFGLLRLYFSTKLIKKMKQTTKRSKYLSDRDRRKSLFEEFGVFFVNAGFVK